MVSMVSRVSRVSRVTRVSRVSRVTRVSRVSRVLRVLKEYSSSQSNFSETNVKLAEKNEFASHSVPRRLQMCKNKQKPNVFEDFRQNSSTSYVEMFHQ